MSTKLLLIFLINWLCCLSENVEHIFQAAEKNQETSSLLEIFCLQSPDHCQKVPESCAGSNCESIAIWNEENDLAKFLIVGNKESSEWVALEFLNSPQKDANIAICQLLPGSGVKSETVELAIHNPSENSQGEPSISDQSHGQTLLQSNLFYCTFDKPTQNPGGIANVKLHSGKSNSAPDANVFSKKLQNVAESQPRQHAEVPKLLDISQLALENYTLGCGETKGCIVHLDALFTYVMMTQADGSEYLHIQLQSDPGMNWIAVGFSHDENMADTSVVECIRMPDDTVVVQHSYNIPGDWDNRVIDSRGLNITEAGIVDTVVKCAFDRKAVYSGDEADSRIFNLTQEYHILLARGNSLGVKTYHNFRAPFPLTNLSEFHVSASDGDDSSMCSQCTIKAHGCLMITAWIFLASLGIFMPRYIRPYMAERKIFKTAAWFLIHRILMILCWCATTAAFVIIFVLKNGDIVDFPSSSPSYYDAHAPIGIAIMALASINPIMALLRCAPDHRRRPIFNWLHFACGTSAQILAVINIFFGIEIAESFKLIDSTVFWLMVAYISFHVVIEAILLVLLYSGREKVAEEGIYKAKIGRMIPNLTLIGIYALVVTGLWIAMVVLISTA